MIKDTIESTKNNLKPSLNVKGMISDAKDLGKKQYSKEGPTVNIDVSKEEFKKRYLNVRFVMFILAILSFYSIYMGVTHPSGYSVWIALLASSICGIFYLINSYRAWMARVVFSKWKHRDLHMKFHFSEYIQELSVNPKQILPVKVQSKPSMSDTIINKVLKK